MYVQYCMGAAAMCLATAAVTVTQPGNVLIVVTLCIDSLCNVAMCFPVIVVICTLLLSV